MVGSHRAGGNRDAVGNGRVLGYYEDVSPEVPLVDLRGCHSFAGEEVGHDVVLLGIHRAVRAHKVHLWHHPCPNHDRRVDELGQKA